MRSPDEIIRNDLLHAFHGALLLTCGLEGTRKFWESHPLHLDGIRLDPVSIARHISDTENLSPLAWALAVQNDLENFLLEFGVPITTYFQTLLMHANRASFLKSRAILLWISPMIATLFSIGDPHRIIFKLLLLIRDRMAPGLILDQITFRKKPDGGRMATIYMAYQGLWKGSLPAWDGAIFTGLLLRSMPEGLGLKPFDPVDTRADARAPEEVVWGANCRRKAGEFRIDGKTFGQIMPFSRHCRENGWRIPDHGQPDREVAVITNDWTCPRRNRVVLKKGCAYGAPGYLYELNWQLEPGRARNFLQHLIVEAAEPGLDDARHRVEHFMRAFLAGGTTTLACVFARQECSFYVDGKHICKGVPALILRNCLRVLCHKGRSEFSFREFKYDKEIISHPKNAGFETRLARLGKALEEAGCGLCIRRTGKGRFILHCKVNATLEERA